MQVTLKIFRYNPEKDKRPHYERYKLEVQPTDRVLDLLEYVKGNHDGTLSFRRSCAHGMCGSDAMRINGRNYLACKDAYSTFSAFPLMMGLASAPPSSSKAAHCIAFGAIIQRG